MTTLRRTRGDTYADEFQVKSLKTKEPTDISTGYSFVLNVDTLDDPPDASTRVFQLTGTITAGSDGKFECAPTAEQVSEAAEHWYQLKMTGPSGRTRTVLKGSYIIE